MTRMVYFLLAVLLVVGILLTACAQSTPSPAAPATTTAATTTTAAPAAKTTSAATTAAAAPTTTAAPAPAATSAKPAATAATTTPRYGGTFKLVYNLSVVNLGYIPDYAAPYDTWIAEADLESLLSVNADGSYGPLLATAWTVAPDYSSVTFTLRQGVKFHDGTDFNAQAVKYNLDLYNKGTSDSLRFISSVDVVDNYTVKVNMGKVQAGFLLNFATRPGEMESPTALAANPKEYFLTHTVGTGPFQMSNNVRDVEIDYTKIANYWQQGKPYLDGINWLNIADKTTALIYFKSGQAQAFLYPAEKDRDGLKAAGYTLQAGFGPVFTLLMDGGNASSPFSNLKVRQAVATAVNKQGMSQALGYGYWVPVNQFSVPTHWSYNKDIVGYDYNVAKAKQLLTDAGYPKGFKTTIYGSGTAGYNELLQADLAAIGIQADISLGTMANVAQWQMKGFTNGLQITPAGGPGPYMDSRIGMTIFGSTSGSYPQIFHSPDVDALLAQSDKEMDANKRIQIYQQVDKLYIDTYCALVPLFLNPGYQAISADAGAWSFQNPQNAKFAPQDAWLKK